MWVYLAIVFGVIGVMVVWCALGVLIQDTAIRCKCPAPTWLAVILRGPIGWAILLTYGELRFTSDGD
jgi:H+/Cl- antiporter ClcA